MSGQGARSRERRENLAELDSVLRDRLPSLDEPIDRSDWAAVVQRSRVFRRSRYRSFALVASGAAVLSLAFTLSLVPLFEGAGHPRPGAAPLRLSLHLSDGSGLVLYSVPERARFFDNSDDRLAGRPSGHSAATVRSLSGGPFHVPAALFHAATTARDVTDGPLPGDRALVSFRVFTNAGLETPAGSAVLTCQYGLDRKAYCDGAVDLEDGMRLTGSGTLNADANHYTLMVTSGYGRDGVGRGVVTASQRDQDLSDLN
jgi:hypothetical protein